MTYEEAHKYLKERLKCHLFNREENEAIKKAIEALEFITPQPPIKEWGNLIAKYKCPRCKAFLAYKDQAGWFALTPYLNVCICGQALDWSGEK